MRLGADAQRAERKWVGKQGCLHQQVTAGPALLPAASLFLAPGLTYSCSHKAQVVWSREWRTHIRYLNLVLKVSTVDLGFGLDFEGKGEKRISKS